MPVERFPYIDLFLGELRASHLSPLAFPGRHIHVGYWPDLASADSSLEDFAAAAERLSWLVCEAGGVHHGQRILDVGCGVGGTVASLNERLSDVDILGLNIDARQIEVARQQVAARLNNSVQFVAGDACQLPFEDDAFDVVTAVECSFHFSSRRAFLHEAKRVLRPGGILSLSDLVTNDDIPMVGTVRRLTLPSHVRSPLYGSLNLSYSLRDYQEAASGAGLESVRTLDITEKTLPTYPVALEVMKQKGWWTAYLETRLVKWFSLLRGIRYLVLSFRAV